MAPSLIEVVPNGVDVDRFAPAGLTKSERLAKWHQWLVDEPRGWDESGGPGTIRYADTDIERFFLDPATGELLPVLLFVGRFLGFKRVPLLVRAYARARQSLGSAPPPLVIWGGYPGEWEGEHPYTVATSLGVEGVFFVGWRGHQDLASGFNCADVFVAPSVDEPVWPGLSGSHGLWPPSHSPPIPVVPNRSSTPTRPGRTAGGSPPTAKPNSQVPSSRRPPTSPPDVSEGAAPDG